MVSRIAKNATSGLATKAAAKKSYSLYAAAAAAAAEAASQSANQQARQAV